MQARTTPKFTTTHTLTTYSQIPYTIPSRPTQARQEMHAARAIPKYATTNTSTQPDSIHNSLGSHLSTPRHNPVPPTPLTSLPPRGLYSSLTPHELRGKGGAVAHLESESLSTSGGGGILYHPVARYTATPCNTPQQTATEGSTLQHPGDGRYHPMERGKAPRHAAPLSPAPLPSSPHTAAYCNAIQHTATHCNTLQNTATHCNTLQHNLFSAAAVPFSTETCARITPHDRRAEWLVHTSVRRVPEIALSCTL